MSNVLEKIRDFLKKELEKSGIKSKKQVLQKPAYDFVEQHVLVNPQELDVNYDLFESCSQLPVSVEYNRKGMRELYVSESFPTQIILPFIRQLNKAPKEIAKDPLMRTVYVIQLENNEKMYVFPNLKDLKNPQKAYKKKELAFNVTPQINRAIVDVIKTLTR